jgi:hypothetical protein
VVVVAIEEVVVLVFGRLVVAVRLWLGKEAKVRRRRMA